MKIEMDERFSNALNVWLKECQEMSNEHYRKNFSNLTPSIIGIEEGSRYVRVVCISDGGKGQKSAWVFIDKTNGDVLKPASFKSPAKWARGNVFDEECGMGCMGPYGPAYLK